MEFRSIPAINSKGITKSGRFIMVKKKKVVKKKVVKKKVVKEPTLFVTTDVKLAYRLGGMGFKVKTVLSPNADRKKKLYIFNDTEKKIKEALNG
jgi:hypothetical protein